MLLTDTLPSVIFLLPFVVIALASDVTLFTDQTCTRSWRALDAVNGYPDGLCKPLNVTNGRSFQIQKLDPGCAVTLYGENSGSLVCSSETKIVGRLATCYDSYWVYYSIDGCLPPPSSGMRSSSVGPTATTLSASGSASVDQESKAHTRIIIGSTVAGTSCIVIALSGMLLISRRRRRRLPAEPNHELSEDRAIAETDAAAEKQYPKELWGDHAAVEMGRNSRFENSVPARGTMQDLQRVRGVNPLIRIHYVQ